MACTGPSTSSSPNDAGSGSLPEGFDVTTITRDTVSAEIEAIRQAACLIRPVVVGHSVVVPERPNDSTRR